MSDGYTSPGVLFFEKAKSRKAFIRAAKRMGLQCDGEFIWAEGDEEHKRAIDPDLIEAVKYVYVAEGHEVDTPEDLMLVEERFNGTITLEEYTQRVENGENLSVNWETERNLRQSSGDWMEVSDADMYDMTQGCYREEVEGSAYSEGWDSNEEWAHRDIGPYRGDGMPSPEELETYDVVR